jgi:hypothetical protein
VHIHAGSQIVSSDVRYVGDLVAPSTWMTSSTQKGRFGALEGEIVAEQQFEV